MTDPPPPPESLNIKQAHFIREHAHGQHQSAEAAAKYVGYSAKRARQTASTILARPDAKGYLTALQVRTEKQCDLDREKLGKFFEDILLAKPSDLHADNPVAIPVYLKDDVAFTTPCKVKIAGLYMDLKGYNAQQDKANDARGSWLDTIHNTRDI